MSAFSRPKLAAVFLAAAALLGGPALGTAHADPAPVVVVDDEFNGSTLDTSVWTAGDSGTDWMWSYLTKQTPEGSVAHPDQVVLNNGEVDLKVSPSPYLNHNYRAGYISTLGKKSFLYGKVESTIKISGGKGAWPAMWLLPADTTAADVANGTALPEVDIFEILGADQSKIDYMTLHNVNSADKTACQFSTSDLSAGYHTYGLDWQPGKMTWLVDGVARCTTTKAVPSEPMFLIINNSVGGCASWGGCVDSSTPMPMHMYVRNVKITQPPASTTVNDNAAGVTYAGTWRTSTGRGYGDYGDDVHYSTVNGDSVSYTFTGTGVDYLTEKFTDVGTADVYIDGVFKQSVNGNAATRQVQQALFSTTGLTPGTHTIKVVKTSGKYLVPDAFRVYST